MTSDLDVLALFTLPGHDRECASAMLSQSRLQHASRIDDIQVRHLLQIGYRAGRQVTEEDQAFDKVDRRLGRWEWLFAGMLAGLSLTVLLTWILP